MSAGIEKWRERAGRIGHWWERQIARRPRILLWAGLVLSVGLAVDYGWPQTYCSPRQIRAWLGMEDDVPNLYYAAAKSSWRDVPKWFSGSWIYPDVHYYRPLSSILFFAQYRLFDSDFTAYNRVTLLLHMVNTALVLLLVYLLLPHYPRARAGFGVLAALWFATPFNSMEFATARALFWWPAQNDVLSLTFGLLSLVLLAYRPGTRGWGRTVASLLAFAASVWSKEMGFIMMPIALALLWYLHRRPTREMVPPLDSRLSTLDSGYLRRRPTREMVLFLAVCVFLWFLRRALVPDAWGPVLLRPIIAQKALWAWGGPLYLIIRAGEYWSVTAAAGVLLSALAGLRRRWPVRRIGALCLLIVVVCAQFMGEEPTWARLLIGHECMNMACILCYLQRIKLFWRYRREEPGLALGGAVWLSYLPILQYGGAHYFYWPGAFQAAANGVFCACLWRAWQEIRPAIVRGQGRRAGPGRDTLPERDPVRREDAPTLSPADRSIPERRAE